MLKKLGISLLLIVLLAVGLGVSGYGGKLFFMAFLAYNSPAGQFDPNDTVPAPDYSLDGNWAALPAREDLADLVPEGVAAPVQGELPVDVFFIHPTGFQTAGSWISPMEVYSGTEENTQWMMANQASAFNGCCNVYAPRYREANVFAYFGEQSERDKMLGFAYQDVKRAFEFYLENYNQGRPFIIAGHSQGSHHARRLLAEVIDPGDLHQRLVAAYLMGAVLIPISPSWFATMEHIAPCQSPQDLHCVVHWDTMPEGAPALERSEPSLCTNPLSWKVDEERAPAPLNDGSVVPVGTFNATIGPNDDIALHPVFSPHQKPLPEQTWAQCENGSLYVRDQTGTGFEAMFDAMGTYHGLDYALFYMNIRNNAILRANTYIEAGGAL